VASLVLTWDAVTVLGSNLSALPRPLETSALVRRGPYRLLRHPIYTSLLGALTGWTLVWKDVALVALALTLLVLFIFKSRLEERWLLQRYPEYEAYRAETGGLFPRVF
jgi:protein-S-isoprenylcysteine O-methyltransferase Ste14